MSNSRYSKTLLSLCEDEQQQKDLKATIVAAKLLTDKLTQLLEKRIETTRIASESKDNYSTASWAYKQADANGEIRGLKFLLDILPKV